MEEDVTLTCPHCWQEISMRLDVSAGSQTYIQDCEVCCNPIEIAYTVDDNRISSLEARPIDQ